jgi:hypothetical protein
MCVLIRSRTCFGSGPAFLEAARYPTFTGPVLFYDLRFSEDEMRGIEGWMLSFQLATSDDCVLSSAVTGNERAAESHV